MSAFFAATALYGCHQARAHDWYDCVGNAICVVSANLLANYFFPVTMRTTPTLVSTAPATISNLVIATNSFYFQTTTGPEAFGYTASAGLHLRVSNGAVTDGGLNNFRARAGHVADQLNDVQISRLLRQLGSRRELVNIIDLGLEAAEKVRKNVSIYPMMGATATPYQIQDNYFVIVPATFGMAAAVDNGVITIAGEPNAGEYLTIVADRQHIYSTTGADTATILATLAAAAQTDYPSASSTPTTLTIPQDADILNVAEGDDGARGWRSWRPDSLASRVIRAGIRGTDR